MAYLTHTGRWLAQIPTPTPFPPSSEPPPFDLDLTQLNITTAQSAVQGYNMIEQTTAYELFGLLIIMVVIIGGLWTFTLHMGSDD